MRRPFFCCSLQDLDVVGLLAKYCTLQEDEQEQEEGGGGDRLPSKKLVWELRYYIYVFLSFSPSLFLPLPSLFLAFSIFISTCGKWCCVSKYTMPQSRLILSLPSSGPLKPVGSINETNPRHEIREQRSDAFATQQCIRQKKKTGATPRPAAAATAT